MVRSRAVPASPDRVWKLVSDPHNLPRWWPETVRVEDVQGQAGAGRGRFTQVFATSKGTSVRADFRCTAATAGRRLVWEQELAGTPFEKFLRSSVLEVRLGEGEGSTEVTLDAERRLRGLSRLGGWMMRRATGRTLAAALEGIERALVGPTPAGA